MTDGALNKVRSGQPAVIPAAGYNAFVDAARDFAQRKHDQGGGTPGGPGPQPGLVTVQNGTDDDLDQFSILAVTDSVMDPDASEPAWKATPVLVGTAPTDDDERIPVILLEPLAAGAIGRAVIAGIVPCTVYVTDLDHQFAEPISADCTKLTSSLAGRIQIVWRQAPDGELGAGQNLLAYVQLGLRQDFIYSIEDQQVLEDGTLGDLLAYQSPSVIRFVGWTVQVGDHSLYGGRQVIEVGQPTPSSLPNLLDADAHKDTETYPTMTGGDGPGQTYLVSGDMIQAEGQGGDGGTSWTHFNIGAINQVLTVRPISQGSEILHAEWKDPGGNGYTGDDWIEVTNPAGDNPGTILHTGPVDTEENPATAWAGIGANDATGVVKYKGFKYDAHGHVIDGDWVDTTFPVIPLGTQDGQLLAWHADATAPKWRATAGYPSGDGSFAFWTASTKDFAFSPTAGYDGQFNYWDTTTHAYKLSPQTTADGQFSYWDTTAKEWKNSVAPNGDGEVPWWDNTAKTMKMSSAAPASGDGLLRHHSSSSGGMDYLAPTHPGDMIVADGDLAWQLMMAGAAHTFMQIDVDDLPAWDWIHKTDLEKALHEGSLASGLLNWSSSGSGSISAIAPSSDYYVLQSQSGAILFDVPRVTS